MSVSLHFGFFRGELDRGACRALSRALFVPGTVFTGNSDLLGALRHGCKADLFFLTGCRWLSQTLEATPCMRSRAFRVSWREFWGQAWRDCCGPEAPNNSVLTLASDVSPHSGQRNVMSAALEQAVDRFVRS